MGYANDPSFGPIRMLLHAEVVLHSGRACYISQIHKRDDYPPIVGRLWPDHRDETAGWSTCRVSGKVNRSECAVRNWWEQWTREGTHARKTGSGATRKITRREDRRIVWQALVDPTVTLSTVRADVGVAIVPQTISRHLAEANLKFKRPFRALPLTPEHRQLRLQWCQARSMWNVTDWKKVVFSDESRFVLGTDDNRVRVLRRPGPFLNGLPGAIFQQDNARPHTLRVAQDSLHHFQTLPWPACSPDLSPVEHVWDQLKRQMPSCHSVHDLELAVQDLWAHLPQDNIRCLTQCWTVWRHLLQLEVVQRAIEVAQYLCRCTPSAPACEDCVLLLAACHNGHSDHTLSAAVFPWRPEENLKHTKKKRNRQGLYDKYTKI
ncbi:transposable element Tc1 transposase [Trichonephila clavipes]|nr:transposable element Tc1 transposase [Trichonephila clavipes]